LPFFNSTEAILNDRTQKAISRLYFFDARFIINSVKRTQGYPVNSFFTKLFRGRCLKSYAELSDKRLADILLSLQFTLVVSRMRSIEVRSPTSNNPLVDKSQPFTCYYDHTLFSHSKKRPKAHPFGRFFVPPFLGSPPFCHFGNFVAEAHLCRKRKISLPLGKRSEKSPFFLSFRRSVATEKSPTPLCHFERSEKSPFFLSFRRSVATEKSPSENPLQFRGSLRSLRSVGMT